MRQQMSSSFSSTNDVDTSIRAPLKSFGGNAQLQQQMLFVQDIDGWLNQQLQVIKQLPHNDQTSRANGVLESVLLIDQAYRRGEEPNVKDLPMAPTASSQPTTQGMSPELRSTIQDFNFSLAMHQERSSMIAGLGGGINENQDIESQIRVASIGNNPHIDGVHQLASQLNGLRLKLPGENSRFRLSTNGDFDSLKTILEHCLQMGIRSPDQVAYILATAWHESRMGKWMTESAWLSDRSAERIGERKYGPNGDDPNRARQMGNTQTGDGGRYMGRGYVQLTWKNNYRRMSNLLQSNGFTYEQDGVTYGDGRNGTTAIDLVTNYRHVNENKDLAARILVLGMDGGHYVGDNRGLDHYIPENEEASHQNFQNARQIVNGFDKRRLIADNAVTFAAALKNGNAWLNLFNH